MILWSFGQVRATMLIIKLLMLHPGMRTCSILNTQHVATHSRPQRPRSFLVSTKNRDLWPSPTPEVRDSRTSRHSAHVQSQVWQIWLVLVSIYCVYKSIQNRNVVGPVQRSRFLVLTKRSAASGDENGRNTPQLGSRTHATCCAQQCYDMKVKRDHRSKFSNLSNWKEEAWKKSGLQQDSNPWPPLYQFIEFIYSRQWNDVNYI